ncbi:MAG: hypothetical protein ABI899_06755 [Actinomycetota bacterium]
MTDETQTLADYAQTLHTAFTTMQMSNPQSMTVAEDRLIAELGSHGLTLSDDIVRALSWAAVEGPEA